MAEGTKARCVFCGTSTGKRTREHIWRNALRSQFPTAESLTFWEQVSDESATVNTRPVSQFDMTLNAVCSECNSGWLNQLEDRALPALRFFALGVDGVPSRDQLNDLAFWAVTRSLLRTHYSKAGRAPTRLFRSTYDNRSARKVPDGCIVSIAPTAPVSMEAGVHQAVSLEGDLFLGHVAVSWGSLLISVLLTDSDQGTTQLAASACHQQRQWFPESFWQLVPNFRLPPNPPHTLEPAETAVAAALLGFLLDMNPCDQFGNRLNLGDVVPAERRGSVPWTRPPVESTR